MKKLLALLLMSGFFAFTSCDTKKTSENEEVIETDTTDVSYEVEETVVETDTTIDVDTTTRTQDVDAGDQK